MMAKTPKSKPMGRPRLPKTDTRSERVVTFVTPSEHRQLKHLANQANQSLSLTCHDLLVQSVKAVSAQGRHDNESLD